MKKTKFITMLICMFILTVFLTGCNLNSGYSQFEIRYTKNLQLFVGEEWHDDLLKGIATKSNGKTEDVTSKMTVDTSKYNKNKVGKYKICCEFADIKIDYEVEVVNEITDTAQITARLQKVMENSIVAKNGVLSFDVLISQDVTYMEEDGQIKQYMYYRENNSIIDMYYKWDLVKGDNAETMLEIWYNGIIDEGFMFVDYNDEITSEIFSGEAELFYVDTINTTFSVELEDLIDEIVTFMDVESLQYMSTAMYSGSLHKYSDMYVLSNSGVYISYVDGKISSFNGVMFEYDTGAVSPNTPVIDLIKRSLMASFWLLKFKVCDIITTDWR